jgi:hypothetical protein
MQRIRSTDYGLEVVLGGPLARAEAEALLAEIERLAPPPGGKFGVLVDARRARAFSVTTQEILKGAILLFQARGMQRQAVVITSKIVKLQGQRLARETGTQAWTRYVDVFTHRDWRQAAVDWLVRGIDPAVLV